MAPPANTAPWQIGRVDRSAQIVAASLALVAVDSLLLWPLTTTRLIALGITVVPALLAIRVIRGFPWSVERGALFLVAALLGATAMMRFGAHLSARVAIALAVVAGGAAFGLGAIVVERIRRHRASPAVISLTRSSEHGAAVVK